MSNVHTIPQNYGLFQQKLNDFLFTFNDALYLFCMTIQPQHVMVQIVSTLSIDINTPDWSSDKPLNVRFGSDESFTKSEIGTNYLIWYSFILVFDFISYIF